jgi:hypothetical protein
MNNLIVDDISRKDMHESNYDLAIFCCGYEPRCTFLSEAIGSTKIDKTIVFSYEEHASMTHRQSIDDYFIKKWLNSSIKKSSASNVQIVINTLQEWFDGIKSKKNLHVLIDYSSMSKAWLSSVIFFFLKYLVNEKEVNITIDFSYSMGEYPKIVENKQFSDPLVVRGCEGSPLTKTKKASIFLLGFDPIGPQALFNSIAPDISYGIYASPSTKDSYVTKVLAANHDFINISIGGEEKMLGLPLSSVKTTYKFINQMILPLQLDYNVTIALYGPKPHVLASILTAISSLNVTCLYSSSVNAEPRLVQGIGELVLTRVTSL